MVAIDADALLKDACGVLQSGKHSMRLNAIVGGTLVAGISEQAFREIGWMSAPAPRGHDVRDADLRDADLAHGYEEQ